MQARIIFYGDSLTAGKPGVAYLDPLAAHFPNAELVNRGKGGDTVKSLYRRVTKSNPPLEECRLAFLWVGVNDVLVKVSRIFKIRYALLRQPPMKGHDEFREYYRKLLGALCPTTQRLFTVSPYFIGEDPMNPWNRELRVLSGMIRTLSEPCPNVTYLDLDPVFSPRLQALPVSSYVLRNLFRSLGDILTRAPEKVDERARSRGLHFTLDGVHFNAAGARIVAEVFSEAIIAEVGRR